MNRTSIIALPKRSCVAEFALASNICSRTVGQLVKKDLYVSNKRSEPSSQKIQMF